MASFEDGIVTGPEVQEHHFNFVTLTTSLHYAGVSCCKMLLTSVFLI